MILLAKPASIQPRASLPRFEFLSNGIWTPPLGFDQLHEYHSGYRAIKPIRSAKENHPLLFIMPDDPPSDVTGSKMPVFQQSADQVHGSMLFQFLH